MLNLTNLTVALAGSSGGRGAMLCGELCLITRMVQIDPASRIHGEEVRRGDVQSDIGLEITSSVHLAGNKKFRK